MSKVLRNMPPVNPETAEFWQGCRDHRLLLQHCVDCKHQQFYPRLVCSQCSSRKLEWLEASGLAKVESFTVMRMAISPAYAEDLPYVVAIVRLAEGPKMMTNIVNTDPDTVSIGLEVSVKFRAYSDDVTVPVFSPVDSAQQKQ